MAVYLSLILVILAALSVLLMLYFLLRALRSRRKSSAQPYNVGQQEAHRSSKVNGIRALLFLLLAIVLTGAFFLVPSFGQLLSPPPSPTTPEATALPTREATLVPTATVQSTAEPSRTVPIPTPTPTLPPTMTSTPEPLTATVSSGVGVWLRASPSTESEQLEWLLEGAIVIVLPGQETAEDLLWQQVQTEEGVAGWVASEFIQINE